MVLADPHPGWRPDCSGYEQHGCELCLRYPTVKLMDFWSQLESLLAQENAFALLTAAHLTTLHTRGQPRQRFAFKLRLTELLYARNEARKEGLQEGREEGRQEGRRSLLCKLLKLRFGPLMPDVERRIALAEPGELSAWEDRLLEAAALDDVFGGN